MEPASPTPAADPAPVSAPVNPTPTATDVPLVEDISVTWVHENPHLSRLEQGLPLSEFAVRSLNKNLQAEFKILSFMTESTQHVNRLFKGEQQYNFNRYPQIIPYRHTMVQLEGPDPGLNYINANFIKLPYCSERVIATQGPLSNTVDQFWRMVDQQRINVIFMLCQLEEGPMVQCYRYWPEMGNTDNCLELTEHKIYPVSKTEIAPLLFQKKFRMVNKNSHQQREIVHYQWRGWGDHEAPREDSYEVLETLIGLAIESLSSGCRLIVHCSAGVGRTGTFLALIQLNMEIQHIQKHHQEDAEDETCNISVFRTVRQLREQRWGMVFRNQQYNYLYSYLRRELS